MSSFETTGETPAFDDLVMEQASAWFLRLRSQEADTEALNEFRSWLSAGEDREAAYMRVQALWDGLDDHAAAPEIMERRQAALARARRSGERRIMGFSAQKFAAIAAALALLLASVPAVLYLQSQGDVLAYATDLGEARTVDLPDNSKISLDAQTKVRVAYSEEKRSIELLEGQAFFDVAKNPGRPFEVTARGQKVVALGTAFNINVEETQISVTLIEGQVAVSGGQPGDNAKTYRLLPGQRLVINADGSVVFSDKVNLDSVTAWRRGKLIFESERLGDAIAQMNRHSHTRISVRDPAIKTLSVSGVFNAGDTAAFVQALENYFSVRAERPDPSRIELYARK